jgi:hypothetical protein
VPEGLVGILLGQLGRALVKDQLVVVPEVLRHLLVAQLRIGM